MSNVSTWNISTWTLTQITFNTEAATWCLKGERLRPPYESERVYALGATFMEALAAWQAMVQARAVK
jgi:hypothetical protein